MNSIQTIDVHTAGEPLRIITGGYPELPGRSILAKRKAAKARFDHLRKLLMWEPRGHADMYGCILTHPTTADGDVGVLFLHNEGYSTMCGHGIIGLIKAGLELELFVIDDKSRVIRIDTPAGRVNAQANWNRDQVVSVTFWNVRSFVLHDETIIETHDLGKVSVTLAFGGAFYAYVRASDLGLSLAAENYSEIIRMGKSIKRSAMSQVEVVHPCSNEELNFLYGVIFVDEPFDAKNHSRNVCVFADGEVDRSPTGTGVSGRAAIHFARKEIGLGESITIESIIGTTFDVCADEQVQLGPFTAIVPKVTGSAHLTGRHEFFVDENDPVSPGFLLR